MEQVQEKLQQKVQCAHCRHLALPGSEQGKQAMLAHGFGCCKKRPGYVFVSPMFKRDCSWFEMKTKLVKAHP